MRQWVCCSCLQNMVLHRTLCFMRQGDTGNRLLASHLLAPREDSLNPTKSTPGRRAQLYRNLHVEFDKDILNERYTFRFQPSQEERTQNLNIKVVYREYASAIGAISVFLSMLYIDGDGYIDAEPGSMSLGAAERMDVPEVLFSVNRRGEFYSDVVSFPEAQWLGNQFKDSPDPRVPQNPPSAS